MFGYSSFGKLPFGDDGVAAGPSTQSLTPALFANSPTFPAPTITTGAVSLSPSLAINSQVFPTPTLLATYALAAALFTNSQNFLTPTVARGAVTLTPSLYANSPAFYTPTVALAAAVLSPTLYTNASTFEGLGSNIVVNGDFASNINNWSAGNSTSSNPTDDPVLSWQAGKIRVARNNGTDYEYAKQSFANIVGGSLYRLTLDYTNPSSIELFATLDGDFANIHQSTASSGSFAFDTTPFGSADILGIGLASGGTGGTAGQYVEFGNVTLRPYQAASVTATNTLTPTLLTNSQTFYGPTITGSISLTPSLFSNSQTFQTPTVSRGAISLTPALVSNSQSFFAPTVAAGAVNLAPALFTDGDLFYTPIVSGATALAPALFTDADTFHAPTVAPGTRTLLPSIFTDGDSFPTPVITQSGATLLPSLFANPQAFYALQVLSTAGGGSSGPRVTAFIL